MLRKLIYALGVLALLAGCESPTATNAPAPLPSVATSTSLPTFTDTPTLIPSLTLTITPTVTASPTPTATPIPASRIPIIEYHDPDYHVGDQVEMTPQLFADQVAWLAANGYQTLSAEELASYLDGSAVFPQKSVVLTFDIGLPKRPVYNDVVIPTLKKYGFKAIFFILSNSGVEQDDCKGDKYFCWTDFKNWAQQGLISVASHGLFHPDFKTLSPAQMTYEMTQSRQTLIDKTGQTPLAFAFPFDSVPAAGPDLVKAAGYKFGVGGISSRKEGLVVLVNDPNRFSLPRVYPYSSVQRYPNLNGYNKPFGDVISQMILPVATPPMPASLTPTWPGAGSRPTQNLTVQPTQASTPQPTQAATAQDTPAAAQGNVDQVLQICQHLPSTPIFRMQELLKASFTPDLSPEAQAKLPGFSTSPSCNFFGSDRPEVIVVHYTAGGDLNSSLYSFRQDNGASAHYIIDRNGKVVQVVPEGLAALHVNCNSTRSLCVASCPICDGKDGTLTEPFTRSVGIELVNTGHIPGPTVPGAYFEDFLHSYGYTYWEDFPPDQIAALKVLVADIAARWNIPIDINHVIGHYRINPRPDPGPALNLFWPRVGNPPRDPIFAPQTP